MLCKGIRHCFCGTGNRGTATNVLERARLRPLKGDRRHSDRRLHLRQYHVPGHLRSSKHHHIPVRSSIKGRRRKLKLLLGDRADLCRQPRRDHYRSPTWPLWGGLQPLQSMEVLHKPQVRLLPTSVNRIRYRVLTHWLYRLEVHWMPVLRLHLLPRMGR